MATTLPVAQPAGIIPHIAFKDAKLAIDFYKKAFGAQELYRLTDPTGKIGHAELSINGAVLMLAEEYPDWGALSAQSLGGSPVALQLYVADVDSFITRSIKAGATLLRPIEDAFYGDRTGQIADPFGYKWSIATRKELVTPSEMQRRWSATFGSA